VFGGRRRGSVVDKYGVHDRVENLLAAHALEDAVNWSGVVVRERHIGRNLDNLAGDGMGKASFACKHFLGESLGHGATPLQVLGIRYWVLGIGYLAWCLIT